MIDFERRRARLEGLLAGHECTPFDLSGQGCASGCAEWRGELELIDEIERLRKALEEIVGFCNCTELCSHTYDTRHIARKALKEEP